MHAFCKNALTLPYKIIRQIHKITLLMFLAGGAMAEEFVILAFGDSLTAGYGLPQADGFVPQLQGWLIGQGADVRVINAGVSGDTTAGGLARIGWVLDAEIDAVILELGPNDFLRGLSPAVARENLDGIMQVITGKDVPVLIAGMPAPGNFGAEYKDEFDAIYPWLAQKYDMPLYPFFMQGIAEMRGQRDVMEFFQPDGLHPTAEGVALIVGDIGPFVLELIMGGE